MERSRICLIFLVLTLFLLINFYALLEILRYFKLKEIKEYNENKLAELHEGRPKVPKFKSPTENNSDEDKKSDDGHWAIVTTSKRPHHIVAHVTHKPYIPRKPYRLRTKRPPIHHNSHSGRIHGNYRTRTTQVPRSQTEITTRRPWRPNWTSSRAEITTEKPWNPYWTTQRPHEITQKTVTESNHVDMKITHGVTQLRHRVTDPPHRVTDLPHAVTDTHRGETHSQHEVTDTPRRVTYLHGRVTDTPRRITYSPGEVTDTPRRITDSHGEVTDSPSRVTDTHRGVTHSQHEVTDTPRRVTYLHGGVTDSPRWITYSPGEVTDTPRRITYSHDGVTESSRRVTDTHHGVTHSHHKVTDTPRRVTNLRGRLTNSPRRVTESHDELTDTARRVPDTHRRVTEMSDTVADVSHRVTIVPTLVTERPHWGLDRHHVVTHRPHVVKETLDVMTEQTNMLTEKSHVFTYRPIFPDISRTMPEPTHRVSEQSNSITEVPDTVREEPPRRPYWYRERTQEPVNVAGDADKDVVSDRDKIRPTHPPRYHPGSRNYNHEYGSSHGNSHHTRDRTHDIHVTHHHRHHETKEHSTTTVDNHAGPYIFPSPRIVDHPLIYTTQAAPETTTVTTTPTATTTTTTVTSTTPQTFERVNSVEDYWSVEEEEEEEERPGILPDINTMEEYDGSDIEEELDDDLESTRSEERIETHTPETTTQYHQPRPTTIPDASEINNTEVTIVTALIDIGRGDWWEYRRPLEKYHEFMENLLSLDNFMVIFTDESSYDFAHKYRKNQGLMGKTKLYKVTLEDLPLSRHLPYAQKIIEDEMKNDLIYKEDPSVKNHPEAKSAEYDVVVNSKTYFLYNVSLDDPFHTDFFCWIDAGYGHGNQSVFPYNNEWKPIFPRGIISLIKLTAEQDPIGRYRIDDLYRRNWSVVSGGFLAGDKRTIGQLYTIIHNKFIHLIYQNKVDDDQTVLVLAINSYPHLFNVVHGDWFDAFRMFSSDAERQFGR